MTGQRSSLGECSGMSLATAGAAETHAESSGRLGGVPRIDDGTTDGPPGRPLSTAWVTLNIAEANELLGALQLWQEELAERRLDPGWHTHLTDSDGNELTIAIEPEEPDRGE
jgi:hypothetical protein